MWLSTPKASKKPGSRWSSTQREKLHVQPQEFPIPEPLPSLSFARASTSFPLPPSPFPPTIPAASVSYSIDVNCPFCCKSASFPASVASPHCYPSPLTTPLFCHLERHLSLPPDAQDAQRRSPRARSRPSPEPSANWLRCACRALLCLLPQPSGYQDARSVAHHDPGQHRLLAEEGRRCPRPR